MLELMSYGLTGMAAMVVTASCFAFSEEFSLALEKRPIHLMDRPRWPLSRRSCERSSGTVYSGVPGESAPGEAFHV